MDDQPEKPSKYFRIKENHPLSIKLDKVMGLMEELGIAISIYGQTLIVEDRDYPSTRFTFVGVDDTSRDVNDFPPTLDYKVIYENPEWIKAWQAELEENRKKLEKLRLEKEAAEAAEKERRRLEQIEWKKKCDLAELARLKAIYETNQ
jgi:hypothetical protein